MNRINWLMFYAFTTCLWISATCSQIGDGGNIIVFALPGAEATNVSNILLNPTHYNTTCQFLELSSVLSSSKRLKQHCIAIHNRETKRAVIQAFQFTELNLLPSDQVYEIFVKTLEAVNYQVDVAIFVVNKHTAYEKMINYSNLVLQDVLRGCVESALVVCDRCRDPDFYAISGDYYKFSNFSNRLPLSELNNHVRSLSDISFLLTATCAARRSGVVSTRCRLWWHQQVDHVSLVGELVVFDEISSCSSLLQRCSRRRRSSRSDVVLSKERLSPPLASSMVMRLR